MARVHRRQSAQKRRKKMGSSVAYKSIGTFLTEDGTQVPPPMAPCLGGLQAV